MMRFATPIAFFLLIIVVAALLVQARWRRRPAQLMSSVELMRGGKPSLRQRLLWIPPLLRVLCLGLLVVAIARPQDGFGIVRTSADAVAIEIVVDRSSSMEEPMAFEGRRASRFTVVKQLIREFVLGDGDSLEGRPYDPIGLVTFARFAETVCPLTRAHDALAGLMEQTEMVRFRAEDGTAIGDAIALAAARLRTAEEDLLAQYNNATLDEDAEGDEAAPEATIKSKIIILLTDGRSNAGDLTPADAAELAAEWGVKIYAIGIGNSPNTAQGLPGGMRFSMRSGVDEGMLRQIADITGGRAWVAESAETLRAVYEEIDALEKTEVHSIEYTNFDERFTPLAALALALLGAEALLTSTLLRRSP